MVVDDPEQAVSVVAAGGRVVLLVDRAAPGVVRWPDGHGRMAVFVGRPDDPADVAAAAAMDRELFGPSGG